MYDSTYGDSWGGYSMSDVTVSDQTYSDIQAGMDSYTQAAESALDHNQYAGSPWSPQNMQRGALIAGDQIPSGPTFTYPGYEDGFEFGGKVVGKTIGDATRLPGAGYIGGYVGGKAGAAIGDYVIGGDGGSNNGRGGRNDTHEPGDRN
jgi:hypothetical protein